MSELRTARRQAEFLQRQLDIAAQTIDALQAREAALREALTRAECRIALLLEHAEFDHAVLDAAIAVPPVKKMEQ